MDVDTMIRNLAARLELVEAKFDHPALAELLRPNFVKHGQSMACEDHDILDDIKKYLWVNQSSFCCYRDLHRDSESVEFRDPRTGRRYEIVIRELDGDDQIGRYGKGD